MSVRTITVAAPANATGSVVRRGFLVGAVMLALGWVALWVALDPLGGLPGMLKVPAVVASLALMYQGYRKLGQAIWGPTWDAMFWLGCAWLVLLVLGAALADVLPLAEHVDITKSITEPGNARPDLLSRHPLGTNNFSLDLLARSLYGARVSLATAMFAVVFALVVGGTLGIAAGFVRGTLSHVIGVVTDAMLAFPALIFLIALAAVLGPPKSALEAVPKTGFALGLVSVPVMIRLARANTLAVAHSDYVTASKVLGASKRRVMISDLAPNVALPLLSYSFVLVAVLILAEGALAFLGLGLQPPNPSWGNMIAEGGLRTLTDYPHIPLVPGAFMFATVLSLNLVGERATARWNPRESNL